MKIVFIVIVFFFCCLTLVPHPSWLRDWDFRAGWLCVFMFSPGGITIAPLARPSNVSEHFRGFCRWQHECRRKKNENHTYEEVCRRRSLCGARDPVVCCLFGFYFDSFIKPTPLPQVMSHSRGVQKGEGSLVWRFFLPALTQTRPLPLLNRLPSVPSG